SRDANDLDFIRQPPCLNQYQNETQRIESFSACFMERYYFCPVFYMGSLQDACQEAFSSTIIAERRPVLVYIHNDRNVFSNIFCSKIFCSEIIIDYLLNNYIVWPWDVTDESNRNKLQEIWTKLFPTTPFEGYSIGEYPMLIGIAQQSPGKNKWLPLSEHEFRTVLECDTLIRTGEKLSKEKLLQELIIFKEECDDSEKNLHIVPETMSHPNPLLLQTAGWASFL
ncbi:unnamed protein product, partial [Adineta steineri]